MASPNCESCGARIEPGHLTCPFCGTITPFGARQHEQDEAARRAREVADAVAAQRSDARGRALAETELARLGRLSLVWSAVGFVLCCLPVPSLVSLVLAYRARVVARERGFVFPAQATIGLLLSAVTLLLSTSFYVFAGVSAVQKQRRIRELEAATAAKAAAETLDHETACALVEIHLLTHGFSSSNDAIDDLRCDGALEQHGPLATVHDVTFELSSAFHKADASLKRGARWMVESVAETPSALATAATAAAPVASAPARVAPHHDAGAPPTKGR